jgi:hypothetical protein
MKFYSLHTTVSADPAQNYLMTDAGSEAQARLDEMFERFRPVPLDPERVIDIRKQSDFVGRCDAKSAVVEFETELILDGFDEDAPHTQAHAERSFSPPEYEWHGNMRIVSERFLATLERAGIDNFIAAPVHMRLRSTQEIREDFWALNVVGRLSQGLVRDQKAFEWILTGGMITKTVCYHETVIEALRELKLPYLHFDPEFEAAPCRARTIPTRTRKS